MVARSCIGLGPSGPRDGWRRARRARRAGGLGLQRARPRDATLRTPAGTGNGSSGTRTAAGVGAGASSAASRHRAPTATRSMPQPRRQRRCPARSISVQRVIRVRAGIVGGARRLAVERVRRDLHGAARTIGCLEAIEPVKQRQRLIGRCAALDRRGQQSPRGCRRRRAKAPRRRCGATPRLRAAARRSRCARARCRRAHGRGRDRGTAPASRR